MPTQVKHREQNMLLAIKVLLLQVPSVAAVETIKFRATNVNGTGSYAELTGTKIQVHTATPSGIQEDAIAVPDSLGNGTYTDDGVRISGFGTSTDTPTFNSATNYYTSNAWSGAVTVAGTSEAITRWGTIKHFTTDLSPILTSRT